MKLLEFMLHHCGMLLFSIECCQKLSSEGWCFIASCYPVNLPSVHVHGHSFGNKCLFTCIISWLSLCFVSCLFVCLLIFSFVLIGRKKKQNLKSLQPNLNLGLLNSNNAVPWQRLRSGYATVSHKTQSVYLEAGIFPNGVLTAQKWQMLSYLVVLLDSGWISEFERLKTPPTVGTVL